MTVANELRAEVVTALPVNRGGDPKEFGQTYANGLRRRSPRPGDRWHLDEVFLKINGRQHYLWRAVDQNSA